MNARSSRAPLASRRQTDLWWRAQVNSTLKWRWDAEILVNTYVHSLYLFIRCVSIERYIICIIPEGVFGVLFWADDCKWGCGNWLLLTVLCRIAVVTHQQPQARVMCISHEHMRLLTRGDSELQLPLHRVSMSKAWRSCTWRLRRLVCNAVLRELPNAHSVPAVTDATLTFWKTISH